MLRNRRDTIGVYPVFMPKVWRLKMTYYGKAYDKFVGMFMGVAGALVATMVIVGSVVDAGMIR
jgi:hypothetical protein